MKITVLALSLCLLLNFNLVGKTVEKNYLAETNFPIVKNNYVIISGCSGGGKSTLLAELANRGYSIICEPGRQIVKEQSLIHGDGLPWIDLQKFLDLALSRYLHQYSSHLESQHVIFFDRGIVDALQLNQLQPNYFYEAANKFRYNRLVFLTPPWEEIFENDAERKHDFKAAQKEFNELLIKYKNFGYEALLIPKVSVRERADFILEKLGIAKMQNESLNYFETKAQYLLKWNKQKLTHCSDLNLEDLSEVFASDFIVIANGRKYEATYQSYYEFLNKFRADIAGIDYLVREYVVMGSTVVMPLTANVKRLNEREDSFNAIMILKFNESGKIIHWEEIYSII